MRVRHPDHDDYVTVFDTSVPVADDGTFPVPDRHADRFLNVWCGRNGYDRDAVVVDNTDDGAEDEPGDNGPETCQVVKNDGEVCGRELPCQYHSEEDN